MCAFIWESAPDPWLFTTNTTFIHYFDFKSKHCYLKCFFSIVIFFTQYSNAVFHRRVYDTLFNVFYFCIYSYIKLFKQVPFAHFERERERERESAVIHSRCLWNYASQKLFKLLYKLFNEEIWIVQHYNYFARAEQRLTRCRCMSCQSSHGRRVISLRSVFWDWPF